MQPLTTDDKGKAETDKLYLGKYVIKETKAPEGYLLNPKEFEVTFSLQRSDNRDCIWRCYRTGSACERKDPNYKDRCGNKQTDSFRSRIYRNSSGRHHNTGWSGES